MILSGLLSLFLGLPLRAQEKLEPYWEYGLGFGYVQYLHYPAANQSKNLFLPFPTFQYRGEVLRADDREGAHAYLLQSNAWTLELSGTGFAPVDSSDNRAREGMPNLPAVVALGPQLLSRWVNDFQVGVGIFEAIGFDQRSAGFRGELLEAQAVYRWEADLKNSFLDYFEQSYGRLAVNFKAASRGVQSMYFAVPAEFAQADREQYEAKGGYLNHEVTYFQSVKRKKAAFYMGASYADFSSSVNRQSPLHKLNQNFSYLVGFTYVLGQSSKPEVPREETSGLLNRFRQNDPF